jgi:hypothetical protein
VPSRPAPPPPSLAAAPPWPPWPPTKAINECFPPTNRQPAITRSSDLQVVIWTAGLKHVGGKGLNLRDASSDRRTDLISFARAADANPNAPAHATLLKECLECSGAGLERDDVVYQIDARPFHDPERRGRGRGSINHLGMSGPVLHGVATDPAFGQWFFNHVRAMLLAAAQAHRCRGRLHVVSFCRAGRHRSVAVASLLARLLTSLTDWEVRVEHLASDQWLWRTCNNCEQCRNPIGDSRNLGMHARVLAEVSLRWAFWQAAG